LQLEKFKPEDRMTWVFKKLHYYFSGFWTLGLLHEGRGCWKFKPEASLAPYLRYKNGFSHHVLLKPLPPIENRCLLLDDLKWPDIEEYHQAQGKWKPGRLVIETSPYNFQVWIRSASVLSIEDKVQWIRYFKADTAAHPKNRWGRCPGFRNIKPCHTRDGRYPLAKLVWVDWLHDAVLPDLNDSFPSHVLGVCQKIISFDSVHRSDYDRMDKSATDFAFALALMRRGATDELVKTRLLAERLDWTNHSSDKQKADYLDRTISNARRILNHETSF